MRGLTSIAGWGASSDPQRRFTLLAPMPIKLTIGTGNAGQVFAKIDIMRARVPDLERVAASRLRTRRKQAFGLLVVAGAGTSDCGPTDNIITHARVRVVI